MVQNFMQLLTLGQTLTDSNTDSTNSFLQGNTGQNTPYQGSSTTPKWNVGLIGFIGCGTGSDIINITVDGVTFDLACGNMISMPFISITLNHYTLIGTGGSYVTQDSTSGSVSQNPGILVFGKAYQTQMF
jgi:hypothetical protein